MGMLLLRCKGARVNRQKIECWQHSRSWMSLLVCRGQSKGGASVIHPFLLRKLRLEIDVHYASIQSPIAKLVNLSEQINEKISSVSLQNRQIRCTNLKIVVELKKYYEKTNNFADSFV